MKPFRVPRSEITLAFSRSSGRYRNRLDGEGLVLVTSERHRDRERNVEDAVEKIEEWVMSVWEKPKPRIKTKPSKGAKRRRVTDKRHDGDKKKVRTEKISADDWD
jgi:ribosome-associated protein